MNAENLLRYRIEIAQTQLRVLQQNLENHNTRWRGVERHGKIALGINESIFTQEVSLHGQDLRVKKSKHLLSR